MDINFAELLNQFTNACVSIAWKLLASAVVFLLGRLFIKLMLKIFASDKRLGKLDSTVRLFINNFIKITLYIVLAITIVGIMGVPMASVLTVFASAGAAVALAVQGSFSNMMGGVMLLIFKPIAVGELIEVGGNIGTVTEVGIFYTKIKTPDNLVVTVPNKTLVDTTIKNYSKNDTRRVDIVVGVAYDSDVELVKRTILSVIKANEKALQDPAPFVRITNMGDSSLDFTVRVWCQSSNFGLLKSDLYEEINAEFNKVGIEIPYNKLDVNIMK